MDRMPGLLGSTGLTSFSSYFLRQLPSQVRAVLANTAIMDWRDRDTFLLMSNELIHCWWMSNNAFNHRCHLLKWQRTWSVQIRSASASFIIKSPWASPLRGLPTSHPPCLQSISRPSSWTSAGFLPLSPWPILHPGAWWKTLCCEHWWQTGAHFSGLPQTSPHGFGLTGWTGPAVGGDCQGHPWGPSNTHPTPCHCWDTLTPALVRRTIGLLY